MELSDHHIDLILKRLRDGRVTDEGLQQDLLDHYCCFIERKMDEGEDFETAYNEAFQAINPNGMHEIEEELFFLLTFKRHTNMKRVIVMTGALVATMLTTGIILKYQYAPGAAVLITSGIGLASLVFMPLVFVLKLREKKTIADKMQWGIGSLFAIVLALSVLFKVQHWPGANILGTLAPAIMLLFFLPVYFYSGYRNRDTRVNTVVTSVFIIVGCGLFYTLVITPHALQLIDARTTASYVRNERILTGERKELEQLRKVRKADDQSQLSDKIYGLCEQLKSYLIKCETGADVTGERFGEQRLMIRDHSAMDYINNAQDANSKLNELMALSQQYNGTMHRQGSKLQEVPVTGNIMDKSANSAQYRVYNALSDLIQIQMILLQNEKGIAAM